MFVYSLSPIDDWRGWQKPEDLFRPAIDTSPEASPTGKGWVKSAKAGGTALG